jgi:hypothetical protein
LDWEEAVEGGGRGEGGLALGSIDFDDFFKVSDKLLFIIKLILTA